MFLLLNVLQSTSPTEDSELERALRGLDDLTVSSLLVVEAPQPDNMIASVSWLLKSADRARLLTDSITFDQENADNQIMETERILRDMRGLAEIAREPDFVTRMERVLDFLIKREYFSTNRHSLDRLLFGPLQSPVGRAKEWPSWPIPEDVATSSAEATKTGGATGERRCDWRAF